MSGWKNIKIEKTQKSANGAMENDVELQRRSTQSRNVSRFSLMSTLELFLSFFLFFFLPFPPHAYVKRFIWDRARVTKRANCRNLIIKRAR